MACRKNKSAEIRSNAADYRGVDVNRADNNRANRRLEKQDTRILNNNPRNGDADV